MWFNVSLAKREKINKTSTVKQRYEVGVKYSVNGKHPSKPTELHSILCQQNKFVYDPFVHPNNNKLSFVHSIFVPLLTWFAARPHGIQIRTNAGALHPMHCEKACRAPHAHLVCARVQRRIWKGGGGLQGVNYYDEYVGLVQEAFISLSNYTALELK